MTFTDKQASGNAGSDRMKRSKSHMSVSALAGLLILIIAALAGTSLWVLVRLYMNTYRTSATMSALQYGMTITRHLAQQPLMTQALIGPDGSAQFEQVMSSLQYLENSLGYVIVTDDDVVIYQKQFDVLAETPALQKPASPVSGDKVIVDRKKLRIGSSIVPLITFTRRLRLADGHERHLEIALKKEIFEREHADVTAAITTMFIASLITIGVAFGICLVAVIGLVQHEARWQRHRRQNEHLAFAGAMASSVIHDFRNPMSAMQLDAQILQQEAEKGTNKDRLIELAGRISKTVARTDDLLKEFLILSKPESSNREPFDINVCMQDCLELVKLRFEKAGILLDVSLSEKALPAMGLPSQFKRAALNILNNAESFSPSGSTVTVKTFIERTNAMVEVADQGPGISRADQERVFEIFFSRRPGGTGIGLALAKTAVENCGGTIRVRQTSTGRGSCFIISIPIHKR